MSDTDKPETPKTPVQPPKPDPPEIRQVLGEHKGDKIHVVQPGEKNR
jgi:hypothetical protein